MFLAHVTDVPLNFKKPLEQYQNKKFLINNGTFKLSNNICPHQQSLIISRLQENIQCQYHAWGWDNNGNPISNGTTLMCNDFKLSMKDTHVSQNLIFSNPIDLSSLPLEFGHMKLVEERIEIVNSSYKNIIDVFLDIDHISVVHPDVYTKVGVAKKTEVEWEFCDWGNIQFVKKNNPYDNNFESTLQGFKEEDLSAVWITVYPYTTIDWQPGCLTIVVCAPLSEYTTKTLIYKYRDIRYNDLNWKINSEIWETAWIQDTFQAKSIVSNSIVESHLDTSKKHFRNWAKINGKI
jgi:phenylpropionate dioxygenase-like ring-hydroxylating dioxygenase large terminal subunit